MCLQLANPFLSPAPHIRSLHLPPASLVAAIPLRHSTINLYKRRFFLSLPLCYIEQLRPSRHHRRHLSEIGLGQIHFHNRCARNTEWLSVMWLIRRLRQDRDREGQGSARRRVVKIDLHHLIFPTLAHSQDTRSTSVLIKIVSSFDPVVIPFCLYGVSNY